MRVDRREIAAIFIGGFVGAVARALIEDRLPHEPSEWPWATFGINIAGALLLGWVVTRLQERLPLSAYRRPLLGTGFCGALTTFSTFQIETFELARGGHVLLAVGYPLVSIVAGMALATAGVMLARWGRHW
jgi:fluoride exporter